MLEFASVVLPDEVRRSDMRVVDGSDRHAVVAFANDATLREFHDRLAAYDGDIPDGQKHPVHMSFFDSILAVRPYGPRDRLADECAALAANSDPADELRLDVQCWYPDDAATATEWLAELGVAVSAAGGRVASQYQNDEAGVLLARVYVPAGSLDELATIDVIATINLLPAPELSRAELFVADAETFPRIIQPAASAPILGLIDSGVASAHPLIAGTVRDAVTLSPHIADGEDRSGHGTMVAALALHGPIGAAIRQSELKPQAQILSVSVLDAEGNFPDQTLWEQEVADAIAFCADQGARVINLSIGDARRPLNGPRQHALAAVIDDLVRRRNIVVVVAAGNSDPAVYLDTSRADVTREYVLDLLGQESTRLLAPASAALAITVGGMSDRRATGGYTSIEPVERRPYGDVNWPSTVTRRGPGISGALKPELVAAAGTHAHEPNRPIIRDQELSVLSAGLGGERRLLAHDIGTSFAAPLVARVSLSILARFPEFSANLVRALTLLGAQATWRAEELEGKPAVRKEAIGRLSGYGETSIPGATQVGDHRAILIAEAQIMMDAVHIYEVPIPTSFAESGGSRYIDVALAFDPRTRSQRLDYVANKMEFYLVRGMNLDDVVNTFAKAAQQVDPDDESEIDVASDADEDGTADPTPLISELGSCNIVFDSSVKVRSRSTNQLGRCEFRRRFEDTESIFLVVRNVNRWAPATEMQGYGIAVSLARDENRTEIYSELSARLEAILEQQIEAEQEVEGIEAELEQ